MMLMPFLLLLLLLTGPAPGLLAFDVPHAMEQYFISEPQYIMRNAPGAVATIAAGVTRRAQPEQLHNPSYSMQWSAGNSNRATSKKPCHLHQYRRLLQPLEPEMHKDNSVQDASYRTATELHSQLESRHERADSQLDRDAKMAVIVSFMEEGHKVTNEILQENFRPTNATSSEQGGGR